MKKKTTPKVKALPLVTTTAALKQVNEIDDIFAKKPTKPIEMFTKDSKSANSGDSQEDDDDSGEDSGLSDEDITATHIRLSLKIAQAKLARVYDSTTLIGHTTKQPLLSSFTSVKSNTLMNSHSTVKRHGRDGRVERVEREEREVDTFGDSRGKLSTNRKTEDGLRLFDVKDLVAQVGEGGDSAQCPFDCSCCF